MLLSGEGDRRWQAEDARSVERGVGEDLRVDEGLERGAGLAARAN